VVTTTMLATNAGPRPRVVVAKEELEAHEARLAQLRKKAGKAVWDQVDADIEAVA
jgi:DNA polymerase-3 subunit epsilon